MSRITSDPAIRDGKPIVAGTDITVEAIVTYAEQGATMSQLRAIFPRLSEDDIRAAIAFSLPSPLKQFVRDQAFFVAALTFAGVGIAVMAIGGLGLSVNLSRSGWPLVFAMAPMYVPAGVVAILAYIAVKRF